MNAGCGYQKFIGLEVETNDHWPEQHPVVMDAPSDQSDGFRFMYVLPFARNHVLVELTYFSDTPALDREASLQTIHDYVGDRVSGWQVIREESGVLPMPWQPPPKPFLHGRLHGGYAGGWFHPATGYSFPVALRFALVIASVPPDQGIQAAKKLASLLRYRWRFARFLNFLLFRLVPPEARWQIFARLYRTLPPNVLARFYALNFSFFDAARILIGRPPRIDLLRLFSLQRSK
jgi:lycopene beta-cyclase